MVYFDPNETMKSLYYFLTIVVRMFILMKAFFAIAGHMIYIYDSNVSLMREVKSWCQSLTLSHVESRRTIYQI
jgi:hypothetical protein